MMSTKRVINVQNVDTIAVILLFTSLTKLSLGQAGSSCITPHQEIGVCKEAKSCIPLYNLAISRGREKAVAEYLRRFQCASNSSNIYVCCPDSNVVDPPLSEASPPQTANSSNGVRDLNSNAVVRKQELDMSSCTTPQQESGICMNVKMCPSIYNLVLQYGYQRAVADYLRLFKCGPGSYGNYVVCCPDSGIVALPPSVSTAATPKNETSTCGIINKKTRDRIVGGQNSSLGDWPWIAALKYKSVDGQFYFSCGGTLVTKQHIITAAHCVSNLKDLRITSVRLGDINLDPAVDDGASPVDIDVAEIIPHPSFTTSPTLNDIAILKLNTSVEFSKFIQPICLLEEEKHKNNSFYRNRRPYIAGWGAVEWQGESSNILQETTIDIVSNEKCSNAYASQRSAKIDDSVICAGQPGRDTCQGDSGGPLIIPIKSVFYLAGVVSYGYKCADPNHPGVYTKIAYFADWIRQNTRS